MDKAACLEAIGSGSTLMLGDGANDSLAFDRALCRGTPVIHRGVLEGKADFQYLGRGIGGIRALFETDDIRRRTHAVMFFSIGYNLLAVGLAVAGRMSPLLAADLMPVNSLLTLAIVSAGMRPRSGVWPSEAGGVISGENGKGAGPTPAPVFPHTQQTISSRPWGRE